MAHLLGLRAAVAAGAHLSTYRGRFGGSTLGACGQGQLRLFTVEADLSGVVEVETGDPRIGSMLRNIYSEDPFVVPMFGLVRASLFWPLAWVNSRQADAGHD